MLGVGWGEKEREGEQRANMMETKEKHIVQ